MNNEPYLKIPTAAAAAAAVYCKVSIEAKQKRAGIQVQVGPTEREAGIQYNQPKKKELFFTCYENASKGYV